MNRKNFILKNPGLVLRIKFEKHWAELSLKKAKSIIRLTCAIFHSFKTEKIRNFLILIFVTGSQGRDLINNNLTKGGPKFTRVRRIFLHYQGITIIMQCNVKQEGQKQSSRGVFRKSCSENMQQLLCNFIEITLRRGCSPLNLLHIFRTTFPKNTSGWLLLEVLFQCKKNNGK